MVFIKIIVFINTDLLQYYREYIWNILKQKKRDENFPNLKIIFKVPMK